MTTDRADVAVVTGAAQGIGGGVAEALASRGMRVAALDRNAAALRGQVDRIVESGHSARACPVDVTDPAAVEEAVAEVERTDGPIGVLVNGAGVLRTGPVTDLADADWNALFAVNVTGVLAASRAVARRMIPRRSGAIVTISSNAGRVPRADMAAYSASKAAATMLTKSLGLELAAYGIRCNVVAPGSTDTPMLRSMWPATEPEQQSIDRLLTGSPDTFKVGIPLGKLAEPVDIAAAVGFLVSPEAGHITLQELYVDGGATLGG